MIFARLHKSIEMPLPNDSLPTEDDKKMGFNCNTVIDQYRRIRILCNLGSELACCGLTEKFHSRAALMMQ